MPSDSSRPQKPTWKGEVPKKTQRKQEAQPDWKREAPAPAGTGKQWTRKTKLGAGALAFLLVNAIFVAVVYWLWPPKPTCLVLLGAGYETNLAVPHNVFGWNGLESLADLSKGEGVFLGWGSSLLQLKHDPKELRSDVEWDKGLSDFRERTVIVYLALHGGADGQGAYLVPQDFDLREDSAPLRLTQVLDRLEKIPEQKKKVLILDATQVPADWPLGLLHNDFARGLRDLNKRIEQIPNLIVLSASDVDQRSWVSEELGKTIFAYYVLEGLKGAADEPPTGDRNGRVDALELHQYVQRNVERWTRVNRDARQTPVLLGGEDRARDIEMIVVKDRYQPPAAQDVPVFEIPKELAEAWEKFQQLQSQVPAPSVYAPHLWRQYQDTLLRYEQLIRAGAQRAVPELKKELDRLEAEIGRFQRLELHALQNTLAMPGALGVRAPWPDLAGHVNELWKARTAERDKKWEEIKQKAQAQEQGVRQRLLQLKLYGQLLDRAAEKPRENLSKAVELLKVVGAVGNHRPAEAHFAAMLDRDLDKKKMPPDELLGQALKLRRLAENTALALDPEARHPYSEQVFPWIKEKIAAADDLRRRGEDRLFATEKESWIKAGEDLQKAGDLYHSAQDDASRVRAAFAARDEILAALPSYSLWMARRRTLDDSEMKALEELWKDVHYLVHLLEVPDPKRITEGVALGDFDVKPRSITAQTAQVRSAFKAMEEDFLRRCNELSAAVLQSVWRDTDDALVVPRLDPALRMKLLANARATSRTFHLRTMDESASDAPGITEERNTELARQAAQRQGRVVLAVLGQRWFDDPSLFVDRNSEKYAEVENRIKKFHTEEKWWASLAKAGEEVGLRWRRMPEEIVKQTESSRKGKLATAASDLRLAERLARLMVGACAPQVTFNPMDESRRLRTHDLLLWQAQRTRHDHWFAEDPKAEPFYHYAGKVYVQDAKSLIFVPKESKERLEAVSALEAQLRLPGELRAAGPARLDVTSERRVPVEYRLQSDPEGWVPPGHPVVWLETGKFLQTGVAEGRRVLEIGEKQPAPPLTFDFAPSVEAEPPRVPRADLTASTLHGVYRGQRIEKHTPIYLHRLPETVMYQQPAPYRSGIAVRAAPEVHDLFAPERGAIAIVLDCSGSMMRSKGLKTDEDYENFRKNYNKNSPCNYHEATQALKRVLERVPKGTRVSVSVFSHKIAGVAEQPPPNETIRQFRSPTPWDPAELPALMDKVESLEPWNETPVVRAMWKAKQEGFPKDFKGFKTLVVLTDGEDNQFKSDKELHALHNTTNISKFIHEEFKDTGVVINLVGFKVAAGEETRFRDQFKEVIEKLPLAGKFYTVNDANQLAGVLAQSVKQKLRFKIERAEGGYVAEMPEEGWDVSRNTESDRWVSLEPGPYVVRVQTNKIVEQRIHLAKGDFILVSLTSDGLHYERVLMGDDYASWRPTKEGDGWLLTVLQNQQQTDRSLEMTVALENRADRAPKQGTLQQVRPRFAWFELKPQDSEEPVAVRWGDLSGYPAPAWNLNVPAWPRRAGAAEASRAWLTVWWNWESDPHATETIKRASGADLENAFKGREIQIGGDPTHKAVIESVGVEERKLETQPGKQEQVSCLVVRLAFPPGKPVWVQLDGLEAQGQEHHFYTQANKYTGIFWAIKKDAAQDKLRALQLISLDRFKREQTTSRLELKLEDLPDTKPRPRTVPELK